MKKTIFECIVIVVAVVLIRSFIATPIIVNGSSMYPTLEDGEYMLLNKISYRFNEIKRGEIIVFEYDNERLIKRVIGLPGEKIAVIDGNLYINDQVYEEDYLEENTVDFTLEELGLDSTIPKGYYFVMGDNRDESKDSRLIGYITEDSIIGKTSFSLYPFSKFGNVE